MKTRPIAVAAKLPSDSAQPSARVSPFFMIDAAWSAVMVSQMSMAPPPPSRTLRPIALATADLEAGKDRNFPIFCSSSG